MPGARTLDLVSDSTFDLTGPPVVERRLRFTNPEMGAEIGLEMVVRRSNDLRQLEIRVRPPRRCDLWLGIGRSAYLVHGDETGAMIVGEVPAELVSVIVLPSEDVDVALQTAWVRV